MKTATIHELKQELINTPAEQLAELCVRLAKFKKENKELLTYLLFESFDEQAYIENIKTDMLQQFKEINTSSLYFVKKSLRKILRTLSKYIRYTCLLRMQSKRYLYPANKRIYRQQAQRFYLFVLCLYEWEDENRGDVFFF